MPKIAQQDGEDKASRNIRPAYQDPINKFLSLQHETFFTGIFNSRKVSFIEGMLGKKMHSLFGNFRDWDMISCL